MFKKKADDELDPPASTPKKKQDEHAYEDSWYRALKAQAERPVEGDEAVGKSED